MCTYLAVEAGKSSEQHSIAIPATEVLAAQPPGALHNWGPTQPTALIAGRQQIATQNDNVTYADVLPRSPGLEKFEFENAFSLRPVSGAWQKARGRAYHWQNGQWEPFWETPPLDFLFGACRPLQGTIAIRIIAIRLRTRGLQEMFIHFGSLIVQTHQIHFMGNSAHLKCKSPHMCLPFNWNEAARQASVQRESDSCTCMGGSST